MPTYIRKTIKLLPWVNLNISKTGPSLSIGPRGAKLNISRKGVYVNSSIRGTGVYNKTKLSTSLVWALGVATVVIGIGYYLGIALHSFNLFVGMCVAGVILGIVTFFVARNIKHAPAEEDDDIEEAPPGKRRPRQNRKARRPHAREAPTLASAVPTAPTRPRPKPTSARWRA